MIIIHAFLHSVNTKRLLLEEDVDYCLKKMTSMTCFPLKKVVFGYGLFGKSVVFVVLPTKQKEATAMASISISNLYRGEGPGEKCGGILNAVFQEVFTGGIPDGCDERTWIELLTVKHTFLIAKKMAEQGDVVSELTDAAPPSATGGKGRLQRRRPIRVTPPWSEKEDES